MADQPKTRQQIAGETKRTRSHEKVMTALEHILTTNSFGAKITHVAICRLAGVGEDTLSKKANDDLRVKVDSRIRLQLSESAFNPKTKRRRIPVSMTAEVALQKKDQEIEKLTQERDDARQTINVLVQILESANFDDASRVVPIRPE